MKSYNKLCLIVKVFCRKTEIYRYGIEEVSVLRTAFFSGGYLENNWKIFKSKHSSDQYIKLKKCKSDSL